jgi:hypothetical protein
MVSNDPACDALQTNSKDNELALAHSKLSRLDWNATDPVHWSSRPCRLAWLGGPTLPMIAIRSPELTLSLRTLTGKPFL